MAEMNEPEPIAGFHWRSISNAPPEVDHIAHYAKRPRLGEHVGQCFTLSDSRWLVLKFSNPGGAPESYIILPEPPE